MNATREPPRQSSGAIEFVVALGLAWLLASLGVHVRDITQIVPVATSILLFFEGTRRGFADVVV